MAPVSFKITSATKAEKTNVPVITNKVMITSFHPIFAKSFRSFPSEIPANAPNAVAGAINATWGVTPIMMCQLEENTDQLFDLAVDTAEKTGIVQQGEVVVITAGVPLGVSGTTNLIKVHVVGHVLMKGKSINDKVVSGNLCVCKTASELLHNYKPGDIIVIEETNNEMMPQLRTASALIVEKGGLSSHAAVVGMSLDIPVLLEAKNATEILKQGAFVTVDSKKGIVYANK